MTAARISVVIPTHNRHLLLLRALHSVLAQSTAAFEIVVVDDASTDATPDIDFAALDRRIRYVRLEHKRGGAVARNVGVRHARGDWIAFLDSDDLWLPGKLQRQLEQIKGPAGRFFLCANVFSDDGRGGCFAANSRPPRADEDLSEYFLVHGCSFQTSALMIPRPLLLETAFDERLQRHQDWDLVLRLVGAGIAYRYLHDPLAVYMNLDDPQRISRMRAPGPTLQWFGLARQRISASGAAYLYSYFYFPRHLREDAVQALATWLRLALAQRRAFRHALAALLRRGLEELNPHRGKP